MLEARILWRDLDHAVARRLVAKAEQRDPEDLSPEDLLSGATLRGLVWHDATSNQHYATAAGIVMLARDPSAVFPQCRILADAYRATEPDGDPRDADVSHAWAALTQACHHHPYELAPTAGELRTWVEVAERFTASQDESLGRAQAPQFIVSSRHHAEPISSHSSLGSVISMSRSSDLPM